MTCAFGNVKGRSFNLKVPHVEVTTFPTARTRVSFKSGAIFPVGVIDHVDLLYLPLLLTIIGYTKVFATYISGDIKLDHAHL